MNAARLAHAQLARMRGMTALYHRRFFTDVWATAAMYLALLVASELGATRVAVVLPFVALFGAVMTAFDASYLTFARHYALRLERFLNAQSGRTVLVGAELEDAYLYRLGTTKVVTIGRPATWFGFVTAFLTGLGVLGYVVGVALALDAIHGAARLAFVLTLAVLTVAALGFGVWWFVGGVGERRLQEVLDRHFP